MPLAAVAYGNEVSGQRAIGAHLSPAEYVRGLTRLTEVVGNAWRGKPRPPPRILGPSSMWDESWVGEMLRLLVAEGKAGGGVGGGVRLGGIAHHLYPLGAGNINAADLISKV